MKKIQALLKDKEIIKNPHFKQIYRVYKACVKHYNKAKALKATAKTKHQSLKKKKAASKAEYQAAKYSLQVADNYKKMWRKLLKAAAIHVDRWVKLQDRPSRESNITVFGKKGSAKKKKDEKAAVNKTSKSKPGKSKEVKSAVSQILEKPTIVAKPKKSKIVKPKPKKTATSHPKKSKSPSPTIQSSIDEKAPVIAKSVVKEPPSPKPAPKTVGKKAVSKPNSKATATKSGSTDDLKKIEGVGPKIEGLLKADGLQTYEQVSKATTAKLQAILDKAGPRYMLARPTTWPQQAKLAAEGKWDELKKWQAELKGGQKIK